MMYDKKEEPAFQYFFTDATEMMIYYQEECFKYQLGKDS